MSFVRLRVITFAILVYTLDDDSSFHITYKNRVTITDEYSETFVQEQTSLQM